MFEALPVDDPKVRQPDITRARELLGWEPTIELDEGLRKLRALAASRKRSLRNKLAWVAASFLAAASVASPSANASRFLQHGDLRRRPDPLRQPRQRLSGVAHAAHKADPDQSRLGRRGRRRQAAPGEPAQPRRPAYDWSAYDRTVNYAAQYRIKVVFSIVGTPPWANAAAGVERRPANPLDLQRFAAAAARRYDGRYPGADGR